MTHNIGDIIYFRLDPNNPVPQNADKYYSRRYHYYMIQTVGKEGITLTPLTSAIAKNANSVDVWSYPGEPIEGAAAIPVEIKTVKTQDGADYSYYDIDDLEKAVGPISKENQENKGIYIYDPNGVYVPGATPGLVFDFKLDPSETENIAMQERVNFENKR